MDISEYISSINIDYYANVTTNLLIVVYSIMILLTIIITHFNEEVINLFKFLEEKKMANERIDPDEAFNLFKKIKIINIIQKCSRLVMNILIPTSIIYFTIQLIWIYQYHSYNLGFAIVFMLSLIYLFKLKRLHKAFDEC